MRASPYTDYGFRRPSDEAFELVRDWWYPAPWCRTEEVTRGLAENLHGSIVAALTRSAPSTQRQVLSEVAGMSPATFMDLMRRINAEKETGMTEMTIRNTARNALGKRFNQFKNLLPTEADAKRFCSIMVQHAEDENLAKALATEEGQKSFVGAALQCAEFNLEPALGQAWLIPYGEVVQFQIGYQGMLELAYRSGHVLRVKSDVVFSKDVFHVDLGAGEISHVPPRFGDRGDVEGFYAVGKLKGGETVVETMSLEEVTEHAKQYSQTFGGKHSPWTTAFNEMAKKTVLKRLLKSLPASIQDKSLAFIDRDAVVLDDNQQIVDLGEAEVLDPESAKPPEFDAAPNDDVRAVITEYWNGNHDAAVKLEGELTKGALKWVEAWTQRNLEQKEGAP